MNVVRGRGGGGIEVTPGWGGVQRRVRRLVPRPVRRADLALFRAFARAEVPVLGPLLPPLSRAANHSKLWLTIAAGSAALGGRFGRRAALRGVVAIGATSALTNLPAKYLAGRQRPDLGVVPEVRRLARVPASTSFPSGHAASAFAFATAFGLERRRARVPLGALATAVAASRVYTGVHYPGDVLVGAVIGAAVARATTRPWPLADDSPATGTLAEPGLPVGADGEGLVVVANADAGGGPGGDPVDRLRRVLPQAQIVTVDRGEDLPDALRRAADGAAVLGVAGGDGSASAAADALSGTPVALLVVPAGTLNHLATDLGISDVTDAIAAARRGRVILADVGELDDRPFVNAASVGVYPHLVADRERWEDSVGKWPGGVVALPTVARDACGSCSSATARSAKTDWHRTGADGSTTARSTSVWSTPTGVPPGPACSVRCCSAGWRGPRSTSAGRRGRSGSARWTDRSGSPLTARPGRGRRRSRFASVRWPFACCNPDARPTRP
jgi:membrane-associated phospholipid phosphatase